MAVKFKILCRGDIEEFNLSVNEMAAGTRKHGHCREVAVLLTGG